MMPEKLRTREFFFWRIWRERIAEHSCSGIPEAFRVHSAEELRGRTAAASRTGRSFDGVQRAAEITRAVLRAAFLTAERRSSDWTVTISPYAATAWRIFVRNNCGRPVETLGKCCFTRRAVFSFLCLFM